MADPRLNSLHLEPVRRQEYRRAREILLQSRGMQTLYAERHRGEDEASSTCIRQVAEKNEAPADPKKAPGDLEFWLVDREFIYPLKVGVNTLGRSADNDVVVEDLYVSRRHCAVLVHHDKTCELHDTASKNGTFLNGSRIPGPTPLKSGDEIRICNRQFVFLTRQNSQASPSSSDPLTHTLAE
jgi:hypothetical protein